MTSIDVRLGSLDDVDEAVSVYERSNLPRRPTTGFSPPACQATYKTMRHIRIAPRTCGQPAGMLGLGSP